MHYALIMALCLVSCSTEEQSETTMGEPIAFSATGIATASNTRATADDSWTDAGNVAIMIGTETKAYTATANEDDDNKATLKVAEGETPFYWNSTKETVTAWYPYSKECPTEFTVNTDQSVATNREASNLMTANATITYGKEAQLEFNHQLSKVTITLKQGDGNPDLKGAKVELTGVKSKLTGINTDNPTATGDATAITLINDPGTDAATTLTGSCIVPPQQFADGLTVKVTVNGNVHIATIPATTLSAANDYQYTLSLSLTTLTLSTASIAEWTDGKSTSAEADFLSKSLSEAAIGDYYASDGKLYPSDISSNDLESIKSKIIGVVFAIGKNEKTAKTFGS